MRTGEVAASAGVNAQTLRYYERRGLLHEPPRRDSGYRAYTSETVKVVRFIKRAQEVGFTLDEVEMLLHLAEGGPANCDAVKVLAQEKLGDLENSGWRACEQCTTPSGSSSRHAIARSGAGSVLSSKLWVACQFRAGTALSEDRAPPIQRLSARQRDEATPG